MRQTSQRAPSSLDRSHHTVTSRIKAGKQRESPTFPCQIRHLDAQETNPKYSMTVCYSQSFQLSVIPIKDTQTAADRQTAPQG